MPDTLATIDDLSTFLDFTFDASDLGRAELILEMSSGEVRDYIGAPLTVATNTDEIVRPEPIRRRLLHLRNRPVKHGSLTLTVDDDEFDGFDLDPATGAVWRVDGSRWPLPWKKEIKATYVHGVDVIPQGIKDVVLQRAAILWVNPEANMQRRRGDASTAFASSADEATGLTKSMREALDRAMASL